MATKGVEFSLANVLGVVTPGAALMLGFLKFIKNNEEFAEMF